MDFVTIAQELAKEGILGLIIVVLGWAYREKEKELRLMDKHIDDLHEKRLEDAMVCKKESIELLDRVTAVTNTLSAMVRRET